MPGRTFRTVATMVAALTVAGSLSACGGLGWAGNSGPNTIRVLMVNNPQMIELQKLAPEFTKETGIKVILFMLVFAGIMLRAKRKVWSKLH